MKRVFLFLFLHLSFMAFSQTENRSIETSSQHVDSVVFVTKLDIARATKDGIYLNGFVVNMSYEDACLLNGKLIRVSGVVSIIKGLKNEPEVYEDGYVVVCQGRQDDTKYIDSPQIGIIE